MNPLGPFVCVLFNCTQVIMPIIFPGGLDFKDTNEKFEMKPVAGSNLFIIRFKSKSKASGTCSCVS